MAGIRTEQANQTLGNWPKGQPAEYGGGASGSLIERSSARAFERIGAVLIRADGPAQKPKLDPMAQSATTPRISAGLPIVCPVPWSNSCGGGASLAEKHALEEQCKTLPPGLARVNAGRRLWAIASEIADLHVPPSRPQPCGATWEPTASWPGDEGEV